MSILNFVYWWFLTLYHIDRTKIRFYETENLQIANGKTINQNGPFLYTSGLSVLTDLIFHKINNIGDNNEVNTPMRVVHMHVIYVTICNWCLLILSLIQNFLKFLTLLMSHANYSEIVFLSERSYSQQFKNMKSVNHFFFPLLFTVFLHSCCLSKPIRKR